MEMVYEDEGGGREGWRCEVVQDGGMKKRRARRYKEEASYEEDGGGI